MAALIELDNIAKCFVQGELAVDVLRDVSLVIHEGEFVAIMGASGSGKTTLMNIIGCMDRPGGGAYRLMGRDVAALDSDALAELRRNVFGFVFQRYNLLAHASAQENVEVPAVYAGLTAESRRTRARTLLVRLGLGDRLDYPPGRLSGGQQQRVSIARALMNGGRVILADEPTGALDSVSGAEVTTLVAADAEAIARLPNVGYVVPQTANPVTVRAGGVTYTTTLTATTPDFTAANNWLVAQGAFFTAAHQKGYAPVAVLGQSAARVLFPGSADPMGRQVLVNNTPLAVIGVLAPKGADQQGNDRDDVVLVPLTTGQARITGQTYLKWITVEVRDMQQMETTQAAIEHLLATRHRKVDFQVKSMTALLQQQAQTQQTLTVMLGAVALISLLVGGIGVMNIMLVSVTERTREIGVRMAVGARAFHIQMQFLIEALVVCTLGGLVGAAGGLAAAAIASAAGAAVQFTVPPVLLAFSSALLTGLVFGYLPARRAAALDPVVALATE